MVVARNKGLLKQWFMLGHSQGCGCLCFLVGICKATQNKITSCYIIPLHYYKHEKKKPFFSDGPEITIYLFFVCAILYLSSENPLTYSHPTKRAEPIFSGAILFTKPHLHLFSHSFIFYLLLSGWKRSKPWTICQIITGPMQENKQRPGS